MSVENEPNSIEAPPPHAAFLVPIDDGLSISRPHPAGSLLEQEAAASNSRRRADARSALGAVFEPLTHVLVPGSDAEGPVQVNFPIGAAELWGLVDRLLIHEDERPSLLSFGLSGTAGVDDRLDFRTLYDVYRPDVGMIEEKLRRGAALVLISVEHKHPALSRVSRDLESLVGPGATMDLVVFGPGGVIDGTAPAGVGVLLVPVEGSLEMRRPPGSGQDAPRTFAPGAGGWLSGSAGAHVGARAGGTAVRVNVPRLSQHRILELAVAECRFHPLLRADTPFDPAAPADSYGGSVYDSPPAFADAVADMLSPSALRRAIAGVTSRSRGAVRVSLGQVQDLLTGRSNPRVRLVAPGGLHVATVDGEASLAFGGVRLVGPPTVQVAVAHYGDGRWFTTVGLRTAGGLDEGAAMDLVRHLLAVGLMEIEP